MKLWCNVCDCVLVDSKDKSTGTMYEAYGHVINYQNRSLKDSETIIFSVCSKCKLTDTVIPTEFFDK